MDQREASLEQSPWQRWLIERRCSTHAVFLHVIRNHEALAVLGVERGGKPDVGMPAKDPDPNDNCGRTLLACKLDSRKVIAVYIIRGLLHFDWPRDDLDHWPYVLHECVGGWGHGLWSDTASNPRGVERLFYPRLGRAWIMALGGFYYGKST